MTVATACLGSLVALNLAVWQARGAGLYAGRGRASR